MDGGASIQASANRHCGCRRGNHIVPLAVVGYGSIPVRRGGSGGSGDVDVGAAQECLQREGGSNLYYSHRHCLLDCLDATPGAY